MSLASSVLIVGHPKPDSLSFGADIAESYTAALNKIKFAQNSGHTYQAIAFTADLVQKVDWENFIRELQSLKSTQLILVSTQKSLEILRSIANQISIFRMLNSFGDAQFEYSLQEAIEEYSLLLQNEQLVELVNAQYNRLINLSVELEERVSKRQQFLENARERLIETNRKMESLHRALVAVHRANTVAEMERLLTEALESALQISWTKIFFEPQNNFAQNAKNFYHVYSCPLHPTREDLGKVMYARSQGKNFSAQEKAFLDQVSEAVSLAIERLNTLGASEELKQQWEATFDAITSPVSILDSQYTILAVNKAYAKKANQPITSMVGRKCYEALWNRTSRCDNCSLGKRFHIDNTVDLKQGVQKYDVSSHEMKSENSLPTFVNLYRDVSEKEKVEKQILESAKMAELGTVGSSIAHELNNPLAGMITFLQLIKMDLKGDEPYASDVIEMESGAQRCKEIIQNLLRFTRKPTSADTQKVDLVEVVKNVIKISDLQSKSLGILTKVHFPQAPLLIDADANLLAQAILNLMQNAIEAIVEKRAIKKHFLGCIEVHVFSDNKNYLIDIVDDGVGVPAEIRHRILTPLFTTKDTKLHTGLGLTISFQILNEYKGSVEIFSAEGEKTTAHITLPKPQQA